MAVIYTSITICHI